MSRLAYERLARTPGVNPWKVARLMEEGVSLDTIQRRLGRPEGEPPSDPFFTPACKEFPTKLLHLKDPPLQIFCKGVLESTSLPEVVVGIVGSRKATGFGLSWARRLGAALARNGVAVCSGLADGIDAAAHRGVLDTWARSGSAGPPIGVLGHGWGRFYPYKNRELVRQVEARGLLLTEYPRGFPPSRWTFPARNRLIAALSDHVVVVEAGARSGSLHTARFALDLGRTLWVVPNAPGRPNSAGLLKLWKDGCEIITDLEEFVYHVTPRPAGAMKGPYLPDLDQRNRRLISLLARFDGDTDRICSEVDWSAIELAYRLTELELHGLVKREIDGRWELLCWNLLGDLL